MNKRSSKHISEKNLLASQVTLLRERQMKTLCGILQPFKQRALLKARIVSSIQKTSNLQLYNAFQSLDRSNLGSVGRNNDFEKFSNSAFDKRINCYCQKSFTSSCVSIANIVLKQPFLGPAAIANRS